MPNDKTIKIANMLANNLNNDNIANILINDMIKERRNNIANILINNIIKDFTSNKN